MGMFVRRGGRWADAAMAEMPNIVMSAVDRLEAAVHKMAAEDHLAKPFERHMLLDTVARWCLLVRAGDTLP
jgi:FixJ family two-component response regulator